MHKKILASGIILMLMILVGCTGTINNKDTVMQKLSVEHNKNAKTTDDLESKFALLSNANTNFCAGPSFISLKANNERLQGSCCSKMDIHRYSEQVEGLKKYSHIDKIPSDPYDIPVSLAKELLEYQKNIKLTAEQQASYDEAMKISHEGGPCCCKCWRWDAFEGLAKYLITEHNFNSEQVAEVWDLVDGCGGKGHIEGMHT